VFPALNGVSGKKPRPGVPCGVGVEGAAGGHHPSVEVIPMPFELAFEVARVAAAAEHLIAALR